MSSLPVLSNQSGGIVALRRTLEAAIMRVESVGSDTFARTLGLHLDRMITIYESGFDANRRDRQRACQRIQQCRAEFMEMVRSQRPLTKEQERQVAELQLRAESLLCTLEQYQPSLLQQCRNHIVAICVAIYELFRTFVPAPALPSAAQLMLARN